MHDQQLMAIPDSVNLQTRVRVRKPIPASGELWQGQDHIIQIFTGLAELTLPAQKKGGHHAG
jgi:hypothetical protein